MNAPIGLPSLSLAVRTPRLGGCRGPFQAAAIAGIELIDLDYRFHWTRTSRILASARQSGVTIRAVWMPLFADGILAATPSDSLARSIADLVEATAAGTLVLALPGSESRQDRRVGRLVASLRRRTPASVRLAFAVRPATIEATREHLHSLMALRRQAEEWDIDLALDLDGPVDPTWESEAALSKILPRLSVVRLGPIQSRPPGRGRERQTARVIAHLADVGYPGVIAMSAHRPLWRLDRSVTLGRVCAETRAKIYARYGSIPSDAPIERSIWSREHR